MKRKIGNMLAVGSAVVLTGCSGVGVETNHIMLNSDQTAMLGAMSLKCTQRLIDTAGSNVLVSPTVADDIVVIRNGQNEIIFSATEDVAQTESSIVDAIKGGKLKMMSWQNPLGSRAAVVWNGDSPELLLEPKQGNNVASIINAAC